MITQILGSKYTKLALPFMLAFAFMILMSAGITLAAPAPDSHTFQQVIQAAPINPQDSMGMMQWLATPTTTLVINTDAYLDYVFQYANLIINALLLISAIKAGVGFGLKLLGQLGSIFGG